MTCAILLAITCAAPTVYHLPLPQTPIDWRRDVAAWGLEARGAAAFAMSHFDEALADWRLAAVVGRDPRALRNEAVALARLARYGEAIDLLIDYRHAVGSCTVDAIAGWALEHEIHMREMDDEDRHGLGIKLP